MIRNILVLCSLFGLMAIYTVFADFSSSPQQQEQTTKTITPDMSTIAPDFPFTGFTDKKKYRLKDFKDKTIVLNFWATWCTPCAIEFPQMLSLAKSLENEKTVFVFLSVDDNKDDITRFLSKNKNKILSKNVIVARDTDKSISQDLFQTTKYPETYLIAPDLRLREKIIGAVENWDSEQMREKFRNDRR